VLVVLLFFLAEVFLASKPLGVDSPLAFECLLHFCFGAECVLASIPLGLTDPWFFSAYCTLDKYAKSVWNASFAKIHN
jgi:hypothetical protein